MLPEPYSNTRLVLFTKSFGAQGFKHKSGYAKYGNPPRWHKVGHDKPAPKGAPVAHSPDAAGAHVPVQLLPEQIEKLKYPAEKSAANAEMAAFNDKHLPSLLAHAEAGDATAILGHGFGTNTHSLKKVAIANFLLSQMGSPHKVTPGQKAGEHAAVKQEPAAPKQPSGPEILYPSLLDPEQKKKIDDWFAAGADPETKPAERSLYLPKMSVGKLEKLLQKQNLSDDDVEDLKDYKYLLIAQENDAAEKGFMVKIQSDHGGVLVPKNKFWLTNIDNAISTKTSSAAPAQPHPEPSAPTQAAPTTLTAPEFQEGKKTQGVKAYYDKKAAAIIAMAQAGDVAGLKAMPNDKGNSWAGKTPNSKKLIELHAAALKQAEGQNPVKNETPSAATASEPTAVAAPEPIKKEPRLVLPTAPKLPEGWQPSKFNPDWAIKPGPEGGTVFQDDEGKWRATPKSWSLSGKLHGQVFDTKAEAIQAIENAVRQAKPVSQPKPESAPAPQATAITPQSGMPDWDAAMLPDSNSNAKSHNGIVAKIKALAESGDVDGLMAVIDAKHGAKQTYAKKQLALAQAAMGALQSAEPVNAPTPAAPEPPSGDQAAVDPLKKLKDDLGFAVSTSQATKIAAAYVVANGHTSSAYSEASDLLSANGYAATAKTFAEASETAKQNEQNDAVGPKDGDTKPGADGGTLVFKDGRWHKQGSDLSGKTALSHMLSATSAATAKTSAEEWLKQNPGAWDELNEALQDAGYSSLAKFGEPTASEPTAPPQPKPGQPQAEQQPTVGLDAVQIPDFESLDPGVWGKRFAEVAAELKADVEQGGIAGLKGKVINHADGRFTIKTQKYTLKRIGPNDTTNPQMAARRAAMHKFVTDLKAAAGKPAKAKKAAAAPAPAPTPSGPPSMDAWTQTGPQGGSNPGGRFKDESGQEWYCKFPSDPETAKSEVLASRLYAAAGLAGQDAMLVTKGGKIGIASKWVSVSNAGGPATLAKVDGAQSGFAVDAWLANWDVVGLGYDNLQIGTDGKAVRIDAGGSLEYRAQGSKKPFGPKVDEIDSLRDKSKNPQAAAVFGGMTNADITASAAKVASITPAQIRALVADHGPGDQAAKKALADTLIARREDLLARFPKADKKTTKKRLDPTALPVDPSVLPKPHDFNNWSGTGKPLSSKQHLNDANLNVEHEMLAMAKQGNLPKLQAFEFQVLDKETGLPTGATKPISQHPSKHVAQFHSDLVQTLDEIANPPQPLKIFRETDVGSLAALDAAFPPKPFGTTVSKVSSTEKLGFWVALGAVSMDAVQKLKPQKTSDYSSAAIAAAKSKFAGASALAKHFIHRIQQSGSYNDLFRNGKEYDNDGNKLSDVAKAALAHATEMPEGTTLYRYQKMTPAMIDHIMSAKDGTVFQATGPMCTSYHPTATSGFGSNRVVIRYAKGAKAVESFASGGYAGEKEVTTLPNARFVILSKTKKPGGNLDLELLMLPPDIGL